MSKKKGNKTFDKQQSENDFKFGAFAGDIQGTFFALGQRSNEPSSTANTTSVPPAATSNLTSSNKNSDTTSNLQSLGFIGTL